MYETELNQYAATQWVMFGPVNLLLEYLQTYMWLVLALLIILILLVALLELLEAQYKRKAKNPIQSSIPHIAEAQHQIITFPRSY